MKVTFYGAAQDVTGSKHMIESNGAKILLDCGMHQGSRLQTHEMNAKLPFEAKTVDAAILSHGHLDHCGMMPMLVKDGYDKGIYCTHATAEVAHLIMQDSANVQKQDHDYLKRHTELHLQQPAPLPPLYNLQDVADVTPQFRPVPYFRISKSWTPLPGDARFKFYDAGHILGSAVTVIEANESGATTRVAYTGDLGQFPVPILVQPEQITEDIDSLIIECTYGDRDHKPNAAAMDAMKKIIVSAAVHNRTVLMPAFALGRVQEIIYMLHQIYDLPDMPKVPIFVDSPLAERLIPVFEKHTEDYNAQVQEDFGSKHEVPLQFEWLKYIQTPDESKELNGKPGPMIIIGSSGMMEGGRILHHLKNRIEDPNTIVCITGYQAAGTLGRKIQDGVTDIKILGEPRQVHAEVITLDEFSAHADRSGLLAYIKSVHGLKRVFLVHTEPPQAQSFMALLNQELPNLEVKIPAPGESYAL